MTTNEFLIKVNNHQSLEENDTKDIILFGCEDRDNYEFIETVEKEDRRWTREMEDIVKIQDKYYAIPWQRGLTENQENDYWDSCPYRVIPKTKAIIYYVPAI